MKVHDPDSKREQKLLFFLPTAAVLVVYAFLIALPKQQQLGANLTALEAKKLSAVNQSIAERSKESLILAQESLDRLRERSASDRLKMKQLGQSWRNPQQRLETIQALTEMLSKYSLSMVTQSYELSPTISSYFKNLAEKIDGESPAIAPIEFWKIEVEGSYSNMQTFLKSINQEMLKTFPLTLSMGEPLPGGAGQKWTIIFAV